MNSLSDRLKWALKRRQDMARPDEDITKAALARACDVRAPSVSGWFSGATQEIEGKNLLAAARFLEVNPDWLATGRGRREVATHTQNVDTQEGGAPKPDLAQHLSFDAISIPAVLKWEVVMRSDELPEQFAVLMPDGALGGKLPQGTAVIFKKATEAQPRQGILVEDRDGHRYIRRYAQGSGGAWQAQALDDAYITLHSERDGLRVLAVMAWRESSEV